MTTRRGAMIGLLWFMVLGVGAFLSNTQWPAKAWAQVRTMTIRRAGVEDLKYGVGTFDRLNSTGGLNTLHKISPINVLAFGVTGDGATDDADSIQAVIDDISAAGGGVLYFPAGTYILGSYHGDGSAPWGTYQALLLPKSNVSIVGDGQNTVFKVADDLNSDHGFNVFDSRDATYGYDVTPVDSVTFANLVIDFNGANNGQQSPMSGYNYYNRGIAIMRGSNIRIENVWFRDNVGQNCVYLGSTSPSDTATVKSAYVLNCEFYNLADDTLQVDHSAIYAIGEDIWVSGNRMVNPASNTHARWCATGMDVHGSNLFVTENVVDNFRIGAFVGGVINSGNIYFSKNTLNDVAVGIALWQQSASVFHNVSIEENVINLRSNNVNYCIGIMASKAMYGYTGLSIIGNKISDVGGAYAATRGINLGANLYRAKIRDNTITDFGYPAIKMLPDLSDSASALALNDVEISDNTIINCGTLASATDIYKSGILISENTATLKRLFVHGNTILDTQDTPTMKTGVYIIGNGDSIYVYDNAVAGAVGPTYVFNDLTDTWASRVTGYKVKPSDAAFDVMAYGALGDGTVDDTAAIQAAIDAAEAAGRGEVLLPPGSYRTTATMTIRPTGTTWTSNNLVFNFAQAEIVADTTLNDPVLKIGDSTGNTNHVTVYGGIIRYAGSARNYDPETTGITLERAYNCEIDGLTVYGAYKGVELIASNGGCVYNRVRVDKIWDCVFGIYLENTATGWVNDNTFDGGSIYYSSSVAAIDLSGGAAIYAKKDAAATYAMVANKFLNMSLEANDAAIPDDKLAKAILLKAWDTNVFGCRFEGFDGSADTISYIDIDIGTWGAHFVGGTELIADSFVRPLTATTLHTERMHRLVGSADYLPAGGPILELLGRGGYDTGYPMLSVIETSGDTTMQVTHLGTKSQAFWFDPKGGVPAAPKVGVAFLDTTGGDTMKVYTRTGWRAIDWLD